MLFAAGFGTRMGHLTADRPKPLIEVAGRPLLDHALAVTEAAGFGPVVVNAHYLAEQIVGHLQDRAVSVTIEVPDILDTGGGLKAALPRLPGPAVATLNTDAVWTGANVLKTLETAWRPGPMGALLALVPADRAGGHPGAGDFTRAPDGRLRRGPGYVFTGAQLIETAPVSAWPEPVFSLNRIWDALAAEGRLYGVVHAGGWCDVGHPGGLAEAEALLRTDASR